MMGDDGHGAESVDDSREPSLAYFMDAFRLDGEVERRLEIYYSRSQQTSQTRHFPDHRGAAEFAFDRSRAAALLEPGTTGFSYPM
jgi:hypothetical protein